MMSIVATDFELLQRQLQALVQDEPDLIANLANASALLYQELTQVNWVGFYLRKNDELVLGPFQGRPACVRIPWAEGVCGTAAAANATLRVEDVSEFPGHIACDSASVAEIVVPLANGSRVWGVLDVDSPQRGRFSAADQTGLETCVSKALADLAVR